MNPTTTHPSGYLMTWRYTAISLWIYVVICWAGPAIRFGADSVDSDYQVRSGIIVVAMAWSLWFSVRPLIDLAEQGLGHDRLSWRERGLHLLPTVVALVVGLIAPVAPMGILFVPWLIVCLLAFDLPAHLRWTWVFGAAAVLGGSYAVASLVIDGELPSIPGEAVFPLSFIAIFTPFAIVFQVWLWELMRQVKSAGDAEAELAAIRERLRMAADLHDVQGHHLQVIALKAELATRQVDRDPKAARESMSEVQTIARQAIDETRDLVRGYRRTSLAEEVANAASVLEATGAAITVDAPAHIDEPLFAIALREATTNILRHSRATRVSIVATPERLTIVNDGAPSAPARHQGTGLAALTSRVADAGGRLEIRHEADEFTLEVTR